MKTLFRLFCSVFLIALLTACGEKSTQPTVGILDEISGVWRASDSTMVSIIYADKKVRLLFGEDPMPVSLGEVDNANKTANLNVTLANGKAGVWTIRQLWDKQKTTFHLQLTTHDGIQDELSFVRKISTDDLNKIANAEARTKPGSIGESVKTAQTVAATAPVVVAPVIATAPTPVIATPVAATAVVETPVAITPAVATPIANAVNPAGPAAPAPERTQSAPTAPGTMAWTPSFDCAKASTGPERLICSNKELSEADVKLAQAYKVAANTSSDKDVLRNAQNAWRKNERDACSDVNCMLAAYQNRTGQLSK
jgi:uncharacterized protein YecT (DUF1311 family)